MISGVPDAAIVALISGFLTVAGIFVNNRIAKRKAPSDAAAALSDAAAGLVDILRSDNAELRATMTELKDELRGVHADLAECKKEHAEKDVEITALRRDMDALRGALRNRNTEES